MTLFQNYDQRIGAVEAFLNMYGISSLGEAGKICADAGIDVFSIVRGVQPICFDDACYAYLVGAAAALKSSAKTAGGDRPDPWRRPAELLHSGFRLLRAADRSWARQTGLNDLVRERQVLLLPGWSQVVRRGRGRSRYCPQCQSGAANTYPCHSQRHGQGRGR